MEVALRRRLDGVADVSISQSEQVAAVAFVSGTRAFSAAAFREAVAEADVTVVSLDLDVCGLIDHENTLRSSSDVATTLLRLRGSHALEVGAVCVTGRLNDLVAPYELDVMMPPPRH